MRTPHGLLPVPLAKITGHVHSSWLAEPCAHVLAWYSRACRPSAYKLWPRLMALQPPRHSGLWRHFSPGQILRAPVSACITQASAGTPRMFCLEHCLPPEPSHTLRAQFKCYFLHEAFFDCPIMINPSSDQPRAHCSGLTVSTTSLSCISPLLGEGLLSQCQPFANRETPSTPSLPNSTRLHIQ